MQYQSVSQLTDLQRAFFRKVSFYQKCPVYVYGSVTRWDYLPGYSDIDAVLFVQNVEDAANSLGKHIGIPSHEIKRTVYKLNKRIILGYKMKYKRQGILVELSVYPLKDKRVMLKDCQTHVAIWAMSLLWMLKIVYYYTGLVPVSQYQRWKRIFMNPGAEIKFVTLD